MVNVFLPIEDGRWDPWSLQNWHCQCQLLKIYQEIQISNLKDGIPEVRAGALPPVYSVIFISILVTRSLTNMRKENVGGRSSVKNLSPFKLLLSCGIYFERKYIFWEEVYIFWEKKPCKLLNKPCKLAFLAPPQVVSSDLQVGEGPGQLWNTGNGQTSISHISDQ